VDRKRMMELVDERMGLSRTTQPEKEDSERTGRQTLKLLLEEDESETQEPEPPVQPKIILYLRDDVNPAEKNFTKHPNEMYDLAADKLTSHETVLYMWTWRISWGFGRNYCRFSRKQVLNKTSINSESSVRRAITGLREKQFIIQVLDENEKPDLNRSGSFYRICSPLEIVSGKVEEGILLGDIPLEGAYCIQFNMSRATMNPGQCEPVQIEPAHNELINRLNKNRLNKNPNRENPDDTTNFTESGQIEPGHDEPALKDRHFIKDSLSPRDIISGFYRGIGQKKVTKAKRERAENNLKEILDDGFSLTDIQFAVKWTLENAKEELYDFSIIKHTIGQAMAAKAEADANEARKAEIERIASLEQEERQKMEEERERVEARKQGLAPEERAKLREKAQKEIRSMDGIKEEFVSEILIEAKENEILKAEI